MVWPWLLNMWPENQWGSSTYTATPAPSLLLIKWSAKRYWADNTVGWEEWFDLDLWTCDLKINGDHLLIEGNPCTKFGIDQILGQQTDIPTDRHTDRPTDSCKTICPLFQGGHKNSHFQTAPTRRTIARVKWGHFAKNWNNVIKCLLKA